MRKFLAMAAAAAVAVMGFSVLASADQGPQDTEWTFAFGEKKVARATGTNSLIKPAKRDTKGTDDPSDDHYSIPAKSVIKFPPRSSVDTGVRPYCKEPPSVDGARDCPNKTQIGTGQANVLLGQPDAGEGSGTEVVGPITAFNRKNEILFLVRPCAPGTGPGKPQPCSELPPSTWVALLGKWKKPARKPKLVVPTPESTIRANQIITRFELVTEKLTKKSRVRIDGRRRTVVRSYATTPSECTGQWKSFAIETYTDGSKLKIPDSQKCRRG